MDAPDDLLDRTEVGLPGLELEEGGGTDTVGGGRLVTELDLGRKNEFFYIFIVDYLTKRLFNCTVRTLDKKTFRINAQLFFFEKKKCFEKKKVIFFWVGIDVPHFADVDAGEGSLVDPPPPPPPPTSNAFGGRSR